jgi:hypothetical protein
MNKIKKLSKKELESLAMQPEFSLQSKENFKYFFSGFLIMIFLFVFLFYYSLLPVANPKLLPVSIIFLIISVLLLIDLIKDVMLKIQMVYITPNDSISKPSFPSFLYKKTIVFIKFNQIRFFQYIRNKDGVCTGIQITTNDNKIIKYKKKFLKERILAIDYFLKYHNVKLNKKPA